MPAISTAQRRAIAIALHQPEKLYKRNRGLLKMSKSDMRDFASTKENALIIAKARNKRKYKKPKRRA